MYLSKKIFRLVCLYFLVMNIFIQAQSGISPNDIERAGQSGWQFLKINGDSRQSALGGAYTAISYGDANSVFGNPASLSDIKNIDIQVNVLKWVADINYQSFAAGYSLGDMGVVGVSLAMLDYGDIPETINAPSGNSGTSPLLTGKNFSANDIVVGFTYSKKITDNLSVGGSVRWMQQQIAELSMSNWSMDIGTMYYTGFRSLRIAITARNFGPDSRFGGWSEEYQTESDYVRMPLDFRAGLAMDFFDEEGSPHLLTAIVEGDHPNDGKEKFHFGMSYAFDGMFFIRAGYKFNYDVQKFTFGAGIIYPIGATVGTINYAYVDFGELTQVHTFSLGFSF
ncbi:MAG: PorV/PorQ family protein [Ignavibacteria bacterium]|nr:PorV/PorQ family protein [Ignavibacteria bacterium]